MSVLLWVLVYLAFVSVSAVFLYCLFTVGMESDRGIEVGHTPQSVPPERVAWCQLHLQEVVANHPEKLPLFGPDEPAGKPGACATAVMTFLHVSNYQAKNQGKISRQAYMDEVARRWDQADKSNQGLTAEQIHQTYGIGATGVAGVNMALGNMGPNNAKK